MHSPTQPLWALTPLKLTTRLTVCAEFERGMSVDGMKIRSPNTKSRHDQ